MVPLSSGSDSWQGHGPARRSLGDGGSKPFSVQDGKVPKGASRSPQGGTGSSGVTAGKGLTTLDTARFATDVLRRSREGGPGEAPPPRGSARPTALAGTDEPPSLTLQKMVEGNGSCARKS